MHTYTRISSQHIKGHVLDQAHALEWRQEVMLPLKQVHASVPIVVEMPMEILKFKKGAVLVTIAVTRCQVW